MAFITAVPSVLKTPCFPSQHSVCGSHSRYSTLRRICMRATLKAREVSAEELEVALQANERPMLVDAFAQWCGPCQFLIPQLDILAEKFGDRLDILKFDTELYPKLASALQVRGDGRLRYRMEGALTAEQLEEIIEFVLFDGPAPTFAEKSAPA